MSLSNQTNKTFANGDGVTVAFSFPYKIFDTSELYVYTISALGVVTGPLTINVNYTVAINAVSEGGIVTMTVAPVSGVQVFIKRLVPYTQAAVIPSEGPLPGPQIENQLDLVTMMVIQINEAVGRAITVPATFAGTVPSLPTPEDGKAIGWDGTSGTMKNLSIVGPAGPTGPAGTNGIYTVGVGVLAGVSCLNNPIKATTDGWLTYSASGGTNPWSASIYTDANSIPVFRLATIADVDNTGMVIHQLTALIKKNNYFNIKTVGTVITSDAPFFTPLS